MKVHRPPSMQSCDMLDQKVTADRRRELKRRVERLLVNSALAPRSRIPRVTCNHMPITMSARQRCVAHADGLGLSLPRCLP